MTDQSYLVNIVEHFAVKEPVIFLRGWWRTKTELTRRILMLLNCVLPKHGEIYTLNMKLVDAEN